MTNKKIPVIHCCETCMYDTYNKKDFQKHLLTKKHLKLTNPNLEIPKNIFYECILCNKKYKHMSSLCKHKKNCGKKEDIFSLHEENKKLKELVNNQNQFIANLTNPNIFFQLPPVQNEFLEKKTIQ